MGSKNTDETPAALNPPQNLQDHRVAEQQEAEARREADRQAVRAREEEIQRNIAEQNAINAKYEAQPRILLRRIQERFQRPRIGVEDRLHAVEQAIMALTTHLMPVLPEIEEKPVPAEPPKEPTDGK